MGASLFGIGKSSLIAYQQALSNTSNNISNVYTDGYNRKTVIFSPTGSKGLGGVEVSNIQRAYQENVNVELRNGIANYNKMSTYYDYAIQFDSLLGDENTNISGGLNQYFSALQNATNDPSSLTARQVLLNNSQTMLDRFHSISKKLDAQYTELNTELSTTVSEVNGIVASIAKTNQMLSGDFSGDLDLLDKRDQLMKELSEYLPFTAQDRGDGAIDIYLGTGDTLVMGGRASELTCTTSSENPRNLDLAIRSSSKTIPIVDSIDGGKIGGLVTYRSDFLQPAEQDINRLALVITESINAQHQEGMDLNDNLGKMLLSDVNSSKLINTRVIANANNSGGGNFNVIIDDATQLETTDYQLTFTSPTDYQLTRISDLTTVTTGTLGTFPETISADGFTLNINAGTFSNGDRFLVAPTHGAAYHMELLINNPEEIALASPVAVTSDNTNTGTGNATLSEITDIDNASFSTVGQLSPPVRIEFVSSTSYQILNENTSAVIEGPITYDPTNGASVFPTPGSFDPGYQVKLSGAPKTGDIFHADYNSGAVGDGRNAVEMTKFQFAKLLDDGKSNVFDNVNFLSGTVSSKAHFSDMSQQASQALIEQAQARRDSVSGVNLDEEAANLLRYQQAYQASAQIISIADSLIDSLLSIL